MTRVILVRPCTGADAGLALALDSTASIVTEHTLRVILSVARAEDPAWPVVEQAAERLRARGMDAAAMIATASGANHKCAQLAAVLETARAEIVACADADVWLDADSLDRLVAPLLNPGGPAATYAPPIEIEPRTLADRASAAVLDSSLHAFPLLARLDPRGFVGKAFAVKSAALDRIGGFAALSDYLGEDIELARRLSAVGERTEAIDAPAQAHVQGRTFSAVIERYARWMTVIRAQRPLLLASYPLLFFPTAFLVAFAPLGVAAVAIVARILVALAARKASRRPLLSGLARAIVLSDLVLFLAFVRTITRRRVVWRGRTLEVRAGGRISEAA